MKNKKNKKNPKQTNKQKKKNKKKNLHFFLIKKHLYMLDQAQNGKTFSNYEATYQKELCFMFEKSGNFFSLK